MSDQRTNVSREASQVGRGASGSRGGGGSRGSIAIVGAGIAGLVAGVYAR